MLHYLCLSLLIHLGCDFQSQLFQPCRILESQQYSGDLDLVHSVAFREIEGVHELLLFDLHATHDFLLVQLLVILVSLHSDQSVPLLNHKHDADCFFVWEHRQVVVSLLQGKLLLNKSEMFSCLILVRV